MPRTSNDTGRALEYILAEKFFKNGYQFGPLATQHRQLYGPYFSALPAAQQKTFRLASDTFYSWYVKNFPNSGKYLEALPDTSGSAVDLVIGSSGSVNNFSVKHNNLDMRHNRPHGLPNRCGLTTTEADPYLEDLYKIEKRMRKEDPANLFRNMKNKDKWMLLINENAMNYIQTWKGKYPSSIETYFNYLISNYRPYYKIEVSDRFTNAVTIHEFLTNQRPTDVALSINSNGYIVLDYDNGWRLTKRIHNASSRVDTLNLSVRGSTGDWKWAVNLVDRPNSISYEI